MSKTLEACDSSALQTVGRTSKLKRKPLLPFLPPEILIYIFKFLSLKDRGRAARVCWAWRHAAYDPDLWKGTEAELKWTWPGKDPFPSPKMYRSLAVRDIGLIHLHWVDLGEDALSDIVIHLPRVRSLKASNCHNVDDHALDRAFSFGPLSELTLLQLRQCSKVTDMGIAMIARNCPRLTLLDIKNCQKLTDKAALMIANGLKHLETLHISGCPQMTDVAIKHLTKLPLLSELLVREWAITDRGLQTLVCHMPSLRTLRLHYCEKITLHGIAFLRMQPSGLARLDLWSCPLITDWWKDYFEDENHIIVDSMV